METPSSTWWKPLLLVAAVAFPIVLRFLPRLRGYQFTAWIVAAVTCPLLYPSYFLEIGPIDLQNKWIFLFIVQAVMFGMGTQMSLKDFAGVAKMPYGVLVGIVCQFTIMPLVGFTLTRIFSFPPEIAAGLILIGACSSGLASNVMVFLARGNLALSITLTSVATLMAPLMTPLWMKLLAGQLVEVKFVSMMVTIIKIVIVPIGAALLHDYLKHASRRGWRVVWVLAASGGVWLIGMSLGGWDVLTEQLSAPVLTWVGLFGFLLAAALAGTLYHLVTLRLKQLDSWMPVASMFGIVYFTAVTTAAGRDDLLKIGVLLFLAAILHNTLGYCFGYGLSRAMRLSRTDARTVAFEVGLQNGAMATGVAKSLGALATMGLASAIFSPWMNISGSILANFWKRKPVEESIGGRAVDRAQ
jgi:BASS family bile acid:Na+ symporter